MYGLFAADPGGSHGFVAEVMATIDLQHFDFRVADGKHVPVRQGGSGTEQRTTDRQTETEKKSVHFG